MIDNSLYVCPHCGGSIIVKQKEMNCRIFRHAVYKKTAKQVNPHMSKRELEILIQKKLIYGCGKPFKIDHNNNPVICGYI